MFAPLAAAILAASILTPLPTGYSVEAIRDANGTWHTDCPISTGIWGMTATCSDGTTWEA